MCRRISRSTNKDQMQTGIGPTRRAGWAMASVWIGFLLAGCAASDPLSTLEGPTTPAEYQTKDWSFKDIPGKTLTSAHYQINTTVTSEEIQDSVVQVMEGALAEYQE